MIRSVTSKNRASSLASVLDQGFWILFLLMVASFSVLTQRFDTALWQIAAGFFFAVFTAFIAAHLFLKMPTNIGGLRSAKTILCLMFAIPVWLLLQTVLPGNAERLFVDEIYRSPPEWWQPESKLSVAPIHTVWLALSYLFLACWGSFAISLLTTRSRVKQLLWVLLLTAFVHAIAGLVALKTNSYLVDKGQVDGHFDVARGFFVNRNHYAASLVLGASAGVALALHMISKIAFHANRSSALLLSTGTVLFILLVIGWAVLTSQSRAGVVAPLMLLGSLSFVVIASKFGTKLGLLSVSILSIALILIVVLFGDQWLSRVSTESFTLGERWQQWKVTLEAIFQAPILGYGGGSYGTVFQMFRDHAEFRQVIYNQSHNQFLHLWLEQGLIGLLLWISLVVVFLRRAIRSVTASPSRLVRAVSLACMVAIGASVLQSAVDFNLQIVLILSLFYLFIALAFAVPYVIHRKL